MITDRQLTDILELSDIPARAFKPSLIRRLRLLLSIMNDPGINFTGDTATGVVVITTVGWRATRKLVPGIPADTARLTVGPESTIIDLYRSDGRYVTSTLYTDEDLFNLANTNR